MRASAWRASLPTRQREGSANGVTFVTLEDETGHVNVMVWKDLGGRERKPLLRSRLMAITGKLQRDGDIVHMSKGTFQYKT